MTGEVVWTPSEKRREQSRMAAFISHVNARQELNLPLQYAPLWEWSVAEPAVFWREVWDFFAVVGAPGKREITNPQAMPGARFFIDGKLNFAENLLQNADARPALIAWNEQGRSKILSRAEVLAQTRQLAGWLRAAGVSPGDCVAAYMPNIPETVIAFLAASSIGAVFSSCSMDFGADSVVERLGQVAPKVLIASDGYVYSGRARGRMEVVADIVERIPSISMMVMVPYLQTTRPQLPAKGCWWAEALSAARPLDDFYRGDFNTPLLALFSSGTTGLPKCIVHGAGGVLLQHLKELALHTDIAAGDRVFYFTTCGWMMWNWLISALALEAAPVLYEGNPLYPAPAVLWDMAATEQVAMFGVSAKYLDAVRNSGISPIGGRDLSALRTICSTGSPLSAEGFDYVYTHIKQDVQLASISGGTDIVSCFALGNPLDPVRRGELQGRGLGMAVAVYDESGQAQTEIPGELVCVAPFPSMPLGFGGDAGGGKYRAAYYEHFAGVWRHGDWVTLTAAGGLIIHGRSDATLNPGGVRIGTAEIYRPVEAFAEIAEALAVGQEWGGDTRIILFVRLAAGGVLDDDLQKRLRTAIRRAASARHVPSQIIAAADFPRTRSGKISEIAVRETVHRRPVKNLKALANPQVLGFFSDLPALAEPRSSDFVKKPQ